MRKWAVFWAFGGVGCGFGALVVIHWPISACRQCGGLPPAAYFSRPGKVGKSGLRASPRDLSGARAPCGGSVLRIWTTDSYRSRARTGQTSFSFGPYRGVGSALGQGRSYGGSPLPANSENRYKSRRAGHPFVLDCRSYGHGCQTETREQPFSVASTVDGGERRAPARQCGTPLPPSPGGVQGRAPGFLSPHFPKPESGAAGGRPPQ